MRWTRAAAWVLLGAGAVSLAAGFYIPAKAAAAQVLLRLAWNRTRSRDDRVRPWPWAHTWPVARLRAPRLDVDTIVLAGAEGAALAFGPGHVDGTPLPGASGPVGNTVLAAHRDTHFRFLADLRLGDELWISTPEGESYRFVVVDTRVVQETETSLLAPTAQPTLTLVTCYPFDAYRPGGPLRFVARAVLASCVTPAAHPSALLSRCSSSGSFAAALRKAGREPGGAGS